MGRDNPDWVISTPSADFDAFVARALKEKEAAKAAVAAAAKEAADAIMKEAAYQVYLTGLDSSGRREEKEKNDREAAQHKED